MNGTVANEIGPAIDRLEAAVDVWVGVLTGAGPVFCARTDLKAISRGEGAYRPSEIGSPG